MMMIMKMMMMKLMMMMTKEKSCYSRDQVLRVEPCNEEQVHLLKRLRALEPLQAAVDEERREMNLNQRRERGSHSFNYGAYHPLDSIYQAMDDLVAEYPQLVSKQQIGESYEKRPLYVLKISSDYGYDPSLNSLLKTMDVFLLVVANPDGYVFSHTKDKVAKTAADALTSLDQVLRVEPCNEEQVQLLKRLQALEPLQKGKRDGGNERVKGNLEFMEGYGMKVKEERKNKEGQKKEKKKVFLECEERDVSSDNPCSDSYHGPSANSEVEVRSIVDFIKSHGNVKAFISIHSYSQLLMYPYGYTCTNTKDHTELDKVAKTAADALTSLNPSILLEKLQSLQCHFTWEFVFEEHVDVELMLKYLTLQEEHTPYSNRGVYTAMRAFLYDRQKRYAEALRTIKEAENVIKMNHPTNFFHQFLVTYGNYAWIYYHLTNYNMVKFCLEQINKICLSLFSPYLYSVDIPEVQAQKGWSLLVGGFQNGREAMNCFVQALRKNASCLEYKAGLAISAYACWTRSQNAQDERMAKQWLEMMLYVHPQNYEIKVYLASLLLHKDDTKVNRLLKIVVEQSCNPEALRIAAHVCWGQSLPSTAISILKQALDRDPTYPMLHYDLGLFYKRQMEMAPTLEDKREALSSAIMNFQKAIELDPLFIHSKLELAKLYGAKSPSFEEEVYLNLLDQVPHFTKRCQQIFYLQWGDFLLRKKGLMHEAQEQYMAGLQISGNHFKELKDRLMNLGKMFWEDSDALHTFLQRCWCHFTWTFAFEDPVDVEFLLQYLTHLVKHTPYRNPGTYLAMKAFLYHLQKHYTEALRSLQEAEGLVKDQCQALVVYGNYAWIYYHLANFSKVKTYLHKIHGICQSLGSPQPYSVATPEILAQKGWSFLASGFQNVEEAVACFQMALREVPTNTEFKAGLATAFYASWEQVGIVCRWDKSKELLEELVSVQPENWEIKVYLAGLLLHQDKGRVKELLEEVVHNSRNPDILRKVAHLCVCTRHLSSAISALKLAISLDANYRLLYYDLGLCYKLQMKGASPDDRATALASATNCFLWAAEMGSLFIDPRLELAKIYGERDPDYEEAVYRHLMEELPNVSTRCKQALHLHWGDFLLQKKGLKHQALEAYKAGVKISGGHFTERDQLERRLMDLIKIFQEDSDMDCVDTIYSLFQTTGHQGPDTQKSCPWWHNHRVWR
ncbi:hypothetical protein JD844_029018 [Phrynosoma platyrhinos]|uniref:Peptidase M14 domain-containing protein n=1 Tax=Phrynosoma platyrhinos TaxID=52577 RepID=A0ABQ7SIT1_PHRPL|nr:hypothetical protein JD844_029018 [Phrynosoma platyrhinos]